MKLNWIEIRTRAAAFASDWAGQGYEKGQTQLFYRDFFHIFGVSVRRVASFEEPIKKLDGAHGFIDLFWKGMLLVEQKSKGGNLTKAKSQAFEYFPNIRETELPRFVLVSDFQTFELYDLDEGTEFKFALGELSENVEHFAFIAGMERRPFRDQDPVNILASELVGKLHDDLKTSGYRSPDLEKFLVRLVFCMFADDTGLFEFRDKFLDLLESHTSESGDDLGMTLVHLFQTMNKPYDKRLTNLDPKLGEFPYVDGGLFVDAIEIPSFTKKMRENLLEACKFDWSGISPAIFGSLFQFVLDGEERRKQGAHYTTEKNILKVLEPLFLTELRREFDRLKSQRGTQRQRRLKEFHSRLAGMTFFDPACGCGNFLVIAYRELRQLEIDLIREIRAYRTSEDQAELDSTLLSLLNVNQFHGIEINGFAVRIAEAALWMMDHIMNNRLSLEFGQTFARIPIEQSPNIICGDALEMDWADVLPPGKCSYIVGNPPFRGAKTQSVEQRSQVRRIAKLGNTGGTLDYVAGWFVKAAEYVQDGNASIGLVATNSITQGEQVAQLWPVLLDRCGLELTFAHRTFAWESEARGKAHVDVVIVGLAKGENAPKNRTLYSYDNLKGDPHTSTHSVLSPYLFNGSDLADANTVVRETATPLNGLPKMLMGSQPIDGGHYIFDDREKKDFLKAEPGAKSIFRPFVGSREFLHNETRWILSLQDVKPEKLAKLNRVRERIDRVRKYRASSSRKSTLLLADFPTQFQINNIPNKPFLVFPSVSSENRKFLPIGWLIPPSVPSNAVLIVENADLLLFGLLTSTMHMCWLRHIGGRLTSRYRYSIGLVYNTFPLPHVGAKSKPTIEALAKDILNARKVHPGSSLSDLYNPDSMPANLQQAHRALDRAVEKLYRSKKFTSEMERLEHLMAEYEKLVSASQS